MLKLLQHADMLHDFERQTRVLEAVFLYALWITLPLGIHLLRVDVVLLLPEQLLRDGVERFLTWPDFTFDIPPCISDNAAAHRPSAVRPLLRPSAVASQHQFHPVQLGAFI